MQTSPSNWERFTLLIPALFLAWGFIFLPAQEAWTSYWLLRDGQKGKAVITKVLWTGHDGAAYRYRVNQQEYTGEGGRNHEDPRYRLYGAQVGEGVLLGFTSLAVTVAATAHGRGGIAGACSRLADTGADARDDGKSKTQVGAADRQK